MARQWSARVKEITILGRMNDVNVQVKMDIDYPEGVNGIDVVSKITEYWHAAGLEPPVAGSKQQTRTTGERFGATGQHPDELKPYLAKDGSPIKCPVCEKKLYRVEGVVKKEGAKNFGDTWVKWICPKSVGGCGSWNWQGNMEARHD